MRFYERENYKSEEYIASDNFISSYINHLNACFNEKEPDSYPYHDPDENNETNGIVDKVFYNDLVSFLNKRSMEIFKKEVFKIENEKLIATSPYDKGYKFCGWILTSDQFGFSAPKILKGKKSALDIRSTSFYPYAKYINLATDKNNAYKVVAECVNNTRTIGGSFIWPKVETSDGLVSRYNFFRGGKSYIEDRVDLTLLEIKHFYHVYNLIIGNELQDTNISYGEINMSMIKAIINLYNKTYPKDILLNHEDKYYIVKWLALFERFENYVDFFCLNDFVTEEYDILDIFDLNKTLKDIEEGYRIKNNTNNFDELEKMIKNVSDLTLKRSETIENKYLNK